MRKPFVLLWILTLAVVAVGLRNFEEGMANDGYLYATIARNIARTGEWFKLDGSIPEYAVFADHPHLHFWTLAPIFKILPAADWSARIPGHVYYVAFLFLFFLWMRERFNERTAVLAVLLLWTLPRFSNYFSSVYIDPGALFWGSFSVYAFDRSRQAGAWRWAALGGLGFALCCIQKGLIILGFGPALAFVTCHAFWQDKKQGLRLLGVFAIAALLPLAAYYVAVRNSSAPNFFEIYHQFVTRYSSPASVSGLWSPMFWRPIWRDTHYLLPLAALALLRPETRTKALLPLFLFAGFYVVFAANWRVGAHYQIMLMPWIIVLVVAPLEKFLPASFETKRLVNGSKFLAIAVVLILQYVPFRAHGNAPGIEMPDIRQLRQQGYEHFYVDPQELGAVNPFVYSWYADVKLTHQFSSKPVVPAKDKEMFFLFGSNAQRQAELRAANWCFYKDYGAASLWRTCPGT